MHSQHESIHSPRWFFSFQDGTVVENEERAAVLKHDRTQEWYLNREIILLSWKTTECVSLQSQLFLAISPNRWKILKNEFRRDNKLISRQIARQVPPRFFREAHGDAELFSRARWTRRALLPPADVRVAVRLRRPPEVPPRRRVVHRAGDPPHAEADVSAAIIESNLRVHWTWR